MPNKVKLNLRKMGAESSNYNTMMECLLATRC